MIVFKPYIKINPINNMPKPSNSKPKPKPKPAVKQDKKPYVKKIPKKTPDIVYMDDWLFHNKI